jgi:hypothetical protein
MMMALALQIFLESHSSHRRGATGITQRHLACFRPAAALQKLMSRSLDVSGGVGEGLAQLPDLAFTALGSLRGLCFGAYPQLALCRKLRLRSAWRFVVMRITGSAAARVGVQLHRSAEHRDSITRNGFSA